MSFKILTNFEIVLYDAPKEEEMVKKMFVAMQSAAGGDFLTASSNVC